MVRVTRFQYPLEQSLVKKIDLMIRRCDPTGSKRDAVLLCEGAEGEGKTTLSIALAYYISEQTGRTFNEKRVFFDVEKMIEYAQSTEKQIIIWDEPALQALSTDWASAAVKNLTRLLMMARKKQHFIIINITKFYKFNEYVVVDRPLALIHVYSRKNLQAGRFLYIRKKYLEPLWRDYRFKKIRSYKKYSSKKVRGSFPDILNPNYKYNVLKEFDVTSYEKNKDAAIRSIGRDTKKEKKEEVDILRGKIANLSGMNQAELAKELGISRTTLWRWKEKSTPLPVTGCIVPLNNNLGRDNKINPEPTNQPEKKKEVIINGLTH